MWAGNFMATISPTIALQQLIALRELSPFEGMREKTSARWVLPRPRTSLTPLSLEALPPDQPNE